MLRDTAEHDGELNPFSYRSFELSGLAAAVESRDFGNGRCITLTQTEMLAWLLDT